jgi:hypothetical protein
MYFLRKNTNIVTQAVSYYKELISTRAPHTKVRRNAAGEMVEEEEWPAQPTLAGQPQAGSSTQASTPPATTHSQPQASAHSQPQAGSSISAGQPPAIATHSVSASTAAAPPAQTTQVPGSQVEAGELLQPTAVTFVNMLLVLVAEVKRVRTASPSQPYVCYCTDCFSFRSSLREADSFSS